MRTMVLEYAHLHLPQKWHSFVGVHIPAPWFASGLGTSKMHEIGGAKPKWL